MPWFNPDYETTEGLEYDHEHWPMGHYRGRGNRQDHTGPNGPWLEGGPARYMTPPQPRPFRNPPKNYIRSDQRIFEEVCEMLAGHGDLDASDIEVIVDDRDVILRGTVRSRWAKWYAEDLAAAVGGVRDVMNELRIARDAQGRELGGPTTDDGGLPTNR
jgi:hypothetical protein